MDGWMHGLQGCTWMYMDACGKIRLHLDSWVYARIWMSKDASKRLKRWGG